MQTKTQDNLVNFDNSHIIKDDLEVSLYAKVEVLEVIYDKEVKFEVNECLKELQMDFIGK